MTPAQITAMVADLRAADFMRPPSTKTSWAAADLIEHLQAETAAMIAAHSAIMAAAVRAGWDTDPHHPTEHIVEWLDRRKANTAPTTA